MADLLFLGVIAGSFTLLSLYVRVCERIVGAAEAQPAEVQPVEAEPVS